LTRILIADDSAHVRRALRACLELNSNWKVCGEAGDGRTAIDAVRDTKPDVVLLDYAMPGMNGLEAAREIASISPGTAMLLFTMYASPHLESMAQDVGIRATISKSVGGVNAIVDAIEALDWSAPHRP
jgi:DNA-binding NarL/FixJ family response regulator